MVMGTPAFMAPEQALAHWDEVDGRTDLWAVGATMFTLLSGQHVHEGTVEPGAAHPERDHAGAVARPAVAPGVPPAVVAIVDRALAFDRDRRWPDARAMQRRCARARAIARQASSRRRRCGGRRRRGARARPGTRAPVVATAARDAHRHDGARRPAVAAWTQEREVRAGGDGEAPRPRSGELAGALPAAKKKRRRGAEAARGGPRRSGTSLEQWFKRQVGTRTAAVEEARKEVRRKSVAIARQAIADRAAFGARDRPAREQIAKLDRAAESAARDVMVHEAALDAYDRRSLGLGVLLIGVAAALLVALIVIPDRLARHARRRAPPPVPVAPVTAPPR